MEIFGGKIIEKENQNFKYCVIFFFSNKEIREFPLKDKKREDVYYKIR